MSYTPTPAEITMLRLRTGETDVTTSAYTDEQLAALLTSTHGDQHGAASSVWTWKAAAVAGLFDWSADGGSYQQSELYDRYMQLAKDEAMLSPTAGGMIIDPTLKPVEPDPEIPDLTPVEPEPEPDPDDGGDDAP